MRQILVVSLFFAFTVLLAPAASFAGPSPDNPCACTFWEPTSSDAMVTSLTIVLEAETTVEPEDKYFLKIVNADGKAIRYIRLTIPEGGEGKVVDELEDPLPASSLHMAVLFSPEINVAMTYLKVVGEMEKGSHTFFDYGCKGVVVGPEGCMWMELW